MLRWTLWMMALTSVLFLGCPPGDDDDDVADDDAADDDTGDDDTGDDDTGDDDTGDEASMTLSETEFYEGAWPWVSVTVDGMELGDETLWCCYDETAIGIASTDNFTTTSVDVMLMIGTLAEGTHTVGLEEAGEQVSAEFEVLPFTIDDVEEGLAAGAGVAGGDTEYDLFHYTHATAGQFVQFAISNPGTAFDPYIWLTQSDGLTYLSQNWYAPENVMVDSTATYFFEPDECFVRICANDFTNDPAQTFDLDVIVSDPLAEIEEVEVESNDDPADPQDLGMLPSGIVYTLTGEVTTVGHDASNIWNEDLDWFAFEVAEDANLSVQLDWGDGADDYDLMIYDASVNTPDPAVFDDLVGWFYAATTNFPERTSTVLRPGVPYVLFVAGWEGDPGPYEVTLALSPAL